MQKPDVLKRLQDVTGENFDSRECRVTNPRITARESIEIADYVLYLEKQNIELRRLLMFAENQTEQLVLLSLSAKPKLPEPPPVRVIKTQPW